MSETPGRLHTPSVPPIPLATALFTDAPWRRNIVLWLGIVLCAVALIGWVISGQGDGHGRSFSACRCWRSHWLT
jgi:hypothetical protein